MNDNEAKSCPFCGATIEIIEAGVLYKAQCPDIACIAGETGQWFGSLEEAVLHWNYRKDNG